MSELTVKELMEAGVHFGHQTQRWNPKMKRYIYGPRNGIYIIDLAQTLTHLNKAVGFVRKLAAGGGSLLFIGTKNQAKDVIVENAELCSMPYVTERWLGGMLTNFETIKLSIKRLRELEGMEADGTFLALSKKEVTKLSKEKAKLEKNLGGIKNMGKLPDAVFVIDPNKEKIALNEARRLGVPVVAIVDTNCNPDSIEHIIPANDDAVRSIRLITSLLAEAVKDGSEEWEVKRKAAEEERKAQETQKRAAEAKARAEREAAKKARAEVKTRVNAEASVASATPVTPSGSGTATENKK